MKSKSRRLAIALFQRLVIQNDRYNSYSLIRVPFFGGQTNKESILRKDVICPIHQNRSEDKNKAVLMTKGLFSGNGSNLAQ